MTTEERTQLARTYYQAYVDQDRDALERMIAPDFVFSSPRDDRLDRATYFERCYPNPALERFAFKRLEPIGDADVVVTYEMVRQDGSRGRNTEILTIRGDQLAAAEVYFGWDVG